MLRAACALVLALAALVAHAQERAEDLIAVVKVNLTDRGTLDVHRIGDKYWIRTSEWAQLGLRPMDLPQQSIGGAAHVLLNAIPGVVVTFDASQVALGLTVDAQLLDGGSNAAANGKKRLTYRSDPAVFANYALNWNSNSRGLPQLALEAGGSHGGFLLLTSAVTDTSGTSRRLVHLGTAASWDDVVNLRRYAAGDVVTRGWVLGPGTRMRGLTLQKVNALDPYQQKAPTYSIGGTVQFPSELEVFVDGRKVAAQKIAPGNFNVGDIYDTQGAHSLRYVLRDPFGREQQVTQNIYFTDGLLRAGLHDYAYSVGKLETGGSGTTGLTPGRTAYSFFHRYAPTDWVTVAGRAEGTGPLKLMGLSASVAPGPWGLIDAAVSRSSWGAVQGRAMHLGYSYQSREWGVALGAGNQDAGYATLSDPITAGKRQRDRSASLVYVPTSSSSFSMTFGTSLVPDTSLAGRAAGAMQGTRTLGLSWAKTIISGRFQIQASLRRIFAREPDTQLSLYAVLYEGRNNTSGSFRASKSGSSQSLSWSAPPPVGEGWGVQALADRTSGGAGTAYASEGSFQYNGAFFVARADGRVSLQSGQSLQQDTSLAFAGSVGMVGGRFFASRPISDSYAVVQVGDVEGVRLFANGQSVATTGASGYAVIPSVGASYENVIALDSATVPVDYALAKTTDVLVPYYRGGALVKFDAHRYRAIGGKIVRLAGGVALPVAFTTFQLADGKQDLRLDTGKKGEFYVEDPPVGTWELQAQVNGSACAITLRVTADAEPFVDAGELRCEAPHAK